MGIRISSAVCLSLSEEPTLSQDSLNRVSNKQYHEQVNCDKVA